MLLACLGKTTFNAHFNAHNSLSQICRSIMLDSHLTTYIPQLFSNILYFLHYFTSKRLRIFISPLFEKKIATTTPERSGLEPKTIRSRIFSLSTWAKCQLTIAGGKKSIKPFRTGQPRTTCASIAALATQRHNALVSHFSSRRTSQWWASYSSWDNTLISISLENTGLIISLAILTSAAPRSICRLGK